MRIVPIGAVLAATLMSGANAQFTTRVSVSESGQEGNSYTRYQSLSGNGRFVAFRSVADNLVPGDTNGVQDIFVLDRSTGSLERVSVDAVGTEANGASERPSISDDGRFVAFSSRATNLVAGDTEGYEDVFVKDRTTGAVVRVSVDSAGVAGNDDSDYAVISGNGQVVAFESKATNFIVNDFNGDTDVYVHDLNTGVTEAASLHPNGAVSYNGGVRPDISHDGSVVMFQTNAQLGYPFDINFGTDVYIRDRVAGTTTIGSVGNNGYTSAAIGYDGSLSGNGRYVSFATLGSDLGVTDTNFREDVYVHDRQTGDTFLASVGLGGVQGDGDSDESQLNHDGSKIVIRTRANNLDPSVPDGNFIEDIYVVDLDTLTARRANPAFDGSDTDIKSEEPVISADGRVAGYGGVATNLVPDDNNGVKDAFVNGPELTLETVPATVALGDTLSISTWRGTPGDLAMRFVIDVNGTPTFFRVETGLFDATGKFERLYTHNNGALSGLSLTYLTFAIGPITGKPTVTNPATATFQ